MAIEISLIYFLTQSCSGACFFVFVLLLFLYFFFFHLLFIYLICTEYLLYRLVINLTLPPSKESFSYLPIILSVCQFEISARIRLNSAFIVGCLKVFLAALSKVFQKASLSLMKEQFSRLAKSATSNIFSYFVSFRATRVKD